MNTTDEKMQLSVEDAFNSLRIFLEDYWRRGRCSSDDIAALLSSLHPVGDEGLPLDKALWNDWLQACAKAIQMRL